MPRIATLANNVEVRINANDHMPAHIHVFNANATEQALVTIVDGTVIEGEINNDDLAVACAYLAANRLALCSRFFAINNKLAGVAADVTARCAALQAAHDAANNGE